MINEMKSIILKSRIERTIKEKWKILMERINSVDISKDTFNNPKYNDFIKKTKYYIIEDIFIKHYGFDCIIATPYGKSLIDFRKLIPSISMIYKSEVIAEYSDNKSSIYMRCHMKGLNISEKDNIKFKWYQIFSDKSLRNNNGETFKLNNSKEIYHPTKKENNKSIQIGYRFNIDIPSGLSYDTLEEKIVDLNKTFGICSLHFDDKNKKAIIEIMNNKVPDNEKYEPIKVKPWQLYVGMTHYYKPIILDFKISPNALFGGASGSGKSVSVIMAMVNLIQFNTSDEVNLYIDMLSNKQDLKLMRNLTHFKYYGKDLNKVYNELKYIVKEMKNRNKLFDESDYNGAITNIYEYNDKFKNNKLPIVYFIIDEVASFSINGSEETKDEENIKKKCNALMWKIAREGRSAGIYSVLCTQRGSLSNMSGEIKGNLSNQVCFYFPNTASSLTILGDGDLATLAVKQAKSREFIAVADEVYHGKALFFSNNMAVNYLKSFNEKNHSFVKIIEENTQKQVKNKENLNKNSSKNKKSRWEIFKGANKND